MKKIIFILLLGATFIVNASSYIVATQSNTTDIAKIDKQKIRDILVSSNIAIGKNIHIDIKENSGLYFLYVGPFNRDGILASTYMDIKVQYPNSFIMDRINTKLVNQNNIISKTDSSLLENISTSSDDTTLWIAVFGLALIGIFFMFISSDQLRRLKETQEKLSDKYRKLELKHNEVLASMGENIHSIAKETINSTSLLAKKVKSTPLEGEVEKVIDNENELLDIAGDLIKFLRLKSNKVVVENAVFNFNNVLNELIGSVEKIARNRDVELVFDVAKNVPSYMNADSSHLLKILTSLVEYAMSLSKNKIVLLKIDILSSMSDGQRLKLDISTMMHIEDKEHMFDAYYDDEIKRYVGLGLFVSKQLVALMDGDIKIISLDENSECITVLLPIKESNREKKFDKTFQKHMYNKELLIIDNPEISVLAIEKLFIGLKTNITIKDEKDLDNKSIHYSKFDIVVLNEKLFTHDVISDLERAKKQKEIEVLSLNSIFDDNKYGELKVVDLTLQKPLTPNNLYEVLESYYSEEEQDKKAQKDSIKYGAPALLVHRDAFENADNIHLERFSDFANYKLLLVEDNFINQKLMLGLLAKSNMDISVANNGQEAVNYLEEQEGKIDFILMDINMPVLDGFNATVKIRSDKRFDHIPIVALTALVAEHEVDKMFDLGMNGFLAKPIKIEKLYSAMVTFLPKGNIRKRVVQAPYQTEDIHLDGLNIEVGMNNTEGNTIFYKEILHEFMDVYGHSDKVFEKLVKEERYGQIKMLCIDMKGLTGTIGAKQMLKVINRVHQNLIYNKPELLHTHIDDYKRELDKLRKSIEAYLIY